MSTTFDRVRSLVAAGDYEVSDHGYDRITARGIFILELIDGVASGVVVEEYPNYHAGPCVLILQGGARSGSVHTLWGLATGTDRPAVLITAYRPDPSQWSADFRKRQ